MNPPTIQSKLSLEAFLELPETTPASEFIHGEVTQKIMPQGEHSRLQFKLCEAINTVAEGARIAFAFPELRCTFGGASIVPDVSVFRWNRIPRQASGRVANRFTLHPDWAIEILSPEQSSSKVLNNLLHCSRHGTELGWLISPQEETILGIFPGQRVEFFAGIDFLPVLAGISLELTVEQVLNWLVFEM